MIFRDEHNLRSLLASSITSATAPYTHLKLVALPIKRDLPVWKCQSAITFSPPNASGREITITSLRDGRKFVKGKRR